MSNIEIKSSPVEGEGVFAKEPIAFDQNIGLGFKKISDTGNPDDDYLRTPLGEKINHSKIPNLKLSRVGDEFYLFTVRTIQPSEELFLNYEDIPWEGKSIF